MKRLVALTAAALLLAACQDTTGPATLDIPGPSFSLTPPAAYQMYVAHGGGNVGAAHGGEIGTIDLTTGAYVALTGSLGSLTSLVSDGTTLYTYETQSHKILGIDPTSGAIVSAVDLLGVGGFTDMAYDPTTGAFYGMGTDWRLHSVDMGTGVTTPIGYVNSPGGWRQIAFAPDGTLYLHATNSPGRFYTIDPSTGAILTTILGGVPGGALGLAVDPASGQLIASECCGGGGGELGEKLFSVNPADGSATLLFDYNDGRRMQDFAFVKQDPQTKDDCKNGGWEQYGFKNQGQCVRFIETGKDSR